MREHTLDIRSFCKSQGWNQGEIIEINDRYRLGFPMLNSEKQGNKSSSVRGKMLGVRIKNVEHKRICWAEKLSFTYYPCTGKKGI
jgi:hypothetical protein